MSSVKKDLDCFDFAKSFNFKNLIINKLTESSGLISSKLCFYTELINTLRLCYFA